MAKKKKTINKNTEVEIITPNVVENAPTEQAQKTKKVKTDKKVNKAKPNSFSEKVKGTYNELKKVSWPSFGRVLKQTGVVLAFVLMFVVILLGFNSLFAWLSQLVSDLAI